MQDNGQLLLGLTDKTQSLVGRVDAFTTVGLGKCGEMLGKVISTHIVEEIRFKLLWKYLTFTPTDVICVKAIHDLAPALHCVMIFQYLSSQI